MPPKAHQPHPSHSDRPTSQPAAALSRTVTSAAILGFYRKHVCRLEPWPGGLERSFAEAGYQVYHTMNGPSEFTVTGTLKTWDIMDRLGEIEVPTLLVGGRYDECTPSHLAAMHQHIRGSQLRIIEDASHLCFAEQPAEFARIVNSFFDLTDRGSGL